MAKIICVLVKRSDGKFDREIMATDTPSPSTVSMIEEVDARGVVLRTKSYSLASINIGDQFVEFYVPYDVDPKDAFIGFLKGCSFDVEENIYKPLMEKNQK